MLLKFRHYLYQIFFVKYYQIAYFFSFMLYFLRKSFAVKAPLEKYEMVFVVFEQGWILDTICKRIAEFFPGSYQFHYSAYSLPSAKAYFFAHYSFLQFCLKRNPDIWGSKLFVFYTHPRDIQIKDLVYAFNQTTKVICMNSRSVKELVAQGVKSDKVAFVIGGADPHFFLPHARASGYVGFCAAYYERKSPDTIFQIIKHMPHRKFMLIGKNWDQYKRFFELIALPNFSYVEAPYAEYPRYYAQMDVFVSTAILEGGPIPLIESMMCNIVPVASKTGFAPDVIRHGTNGFLFDVDAQPEIICGLIEQAFLLDTDVRETVLHLTWENFASESLNLMEYPRKS